MNLRIFTKFFLLLAMLAAAYVPGTAMAATLSAASFEERVVVNHNNPVEGQYYVVSEGANDQVGEHLQITSNSSKGYGGGWAASLASAGSPPTADGDVSIAAGSVFNGAVGGGSLTKISYQFAIERLDGLVGPGAVPITISVSGSVYVEEFNSTTSSATAYVQTSATSNAWRANVNNVDGIGQDSFQDSETVNISPGWVYTVYMETLVQGGVYYAGSYFRGKAVVDPIIEFAEGFEDADQYGIFLSPGIDAVPLPSSFMLLALGLIPLIRRSRR